MINIFGLALGAAFIKELETAITLLLFQDQLCSHLLANQVEFRCDRIFATGIRFTMRYAVFLNIILNHLELFSAIHFSISSRAGPNACALKR
jgi:hypothetical protein